MKQFIFASLLLISFVGFGQNALQSDLEKNSYSVLLNNMSESVEIEIDHNKNIYSSKQAKLILTNFFHEKGMAEFKTLHNGVAKSKEHFLIGTFRGKNRTYKMNIKYLSGDKLRIQFISIN